MNNLKQEYLKQLHEKEKELYNLIDFKKENSFEKFLNYFDDIEDEDIEFTVNGNLDYISANICIGYCPLFWIDTNYERLYISENGITESISLNQLFIKHVNDYFENYFRNVR